MHLPSVLSLIYVGFMTVEKLVSGKKKKTLQGLRPLSVKGVFFQ